MKVYRLKFFLICLLISIANYSLAQTKKVSVSGVVLSINNTPIENVNIYNEKYRIGCKTNDKGEFNLEIYPDANLVFSNVGYESKEIQLFKSSSDTNLYLIVRLVQKTYDLVGVEIFSEKPTLVIKDKSIWIYDFEFSDSLLFVLASKDNKTAVCILNPQSSFDTISSGIFPKRLINLYKDCFGLIHCFDKDSAYQIFFQNNYLQLIYPTPLDKFNGTLKNIHISTANYLFVYRIKDFNQTTEYVKINKSSKKIEPLCAVTDKKQFEANRSHYKDMLRDGRLSKNKSSSIADYDFENHEVQNEQETSENGMTTIVNVAKLSNKYHSEMTGDRFFQLIMMHKKYNPLLLIRDSLYFFGLVENKLEIFTEDGVYIRKTPIDYQNTSSKLVEVLVDESNSKCYASFLLNNGLLKLKQIDLTTGNLKNEIVFGKFIFPKKVRIYNDKIYILYKDQDNQFNSNRNLYFNKL